MGLRIKDCVNLLNQEVKSPEPIKELLIRDHLTPHQKDYLDARTKALEFRKKTIDNKDYQLQQDIESIEKMLPEGVKLVGFKIDEQDEVTKDMIDKIKLSSNPSCQKRDFAKVFRHGDIEITIADDNSAWFLNKEDQNNPFWVRMVDSGYPDLPQD